MTYSLRSTTLLLSAAILIAAGSVRAQEIKHSFLACGQKTYIMNEDGQVEWSYPASTRDGYVLGDGTVLLTLSKSQKYRGGAVLLVGRDGGERIIWEGTQSEVNSAQPTTDGNFVLTEAGKNPRLLEVDSAGTIVNEFPLACQKGNHHMQTRMARKLEDGTYLAPHLLDFAVIHYSAKGKVLAKLDTTVSGDTEHKVHTWPFTAIRSNNGETFVCCTHGNRVVAFNSEGKISWQLTNEDLPGDWLQDPCGAQLLQNGNIVITSYAAGRADPYAPKIFEVTRDKKVVWRFADGQKSGVHHFQIISTNGKILEGTPLK